MKNVEAIVMLAELALKATALAQRNKVTEAEIIDVLDLPENAGLTPAQRLKIIRFLTDQKADAAQSAIDSISSNTLS